MSREEFIQLIAPLAKENMKKTGILASLTIAQACLESNFGQSGLAQKSKNLFGIKGKGTAGSDLWPTTEYDSKGNPYQINAAFRKYNDWSESIDDHSTLFLRLSIYANLRDEKDYKKACTYVREDGYATDPSYTNLLISLIEQYKLYQYDEDDEYMIKPEDAKQICYWLGTLWQKADNQASKNEFHRLADEVRKAAGMEVQS